MVPDTLCLEYLRCRIHRPANIRVNTAKGAHLLWAPFIMIKFIGRTCHKAGYTLSNII